MQIGVKCEKKRKDKTNTWREETMKLIVISFFISALLACIAIGMNLLLGMSIERAMIDIVNPFKVMSPTEMVMLFFIIGLWGLELFVAKKASLRLPQGGNSQKPQRVEQHDERCAHVGENRQP